MSEVPATGTPTVMPSLTGDRTSPSRSDEFLAAVDAHMLELVGVARQPMRDIATAAIASGGKRLRPQLVWCTEPRNADLRARWELGAVNVAAAIELIHTATLVHDDVLDGAELRRGEQTVTAQHGLPAATACGDYLFAKAFRTLVDTRLHDGPNAALEHVTLLAEVSRALAEGEALQAAQLRDTSLDVTSYLLRCQGKTGVLFGAALELGMRAGGSTEEQTGKLGLFGRMIGVAFQIVDDMLDCGTSEQAEVLGKTPGADLRDGTITLPMMYAMEAHPELARDLSSQLDPARIDSVLFAIRATDALERSRATAISMVTEARDLLGDIDLHLDAARLHAVADRAISRLS